MRKVAIIFMASVIGFGCETVITIKMPKPVADPFYRFISNGRIGFIDGTGRIVIPATSTNLFMGDFREGLLKVDYSPTRFVDAQGKTILASSMRIGEFHEGLAAAGGGNPEMPVGFVDHSGKLVLAVHFPHSTSGSAGEFSDGLAKMELNGKVGYIDHKGTFVVPQLFAAGTKFENGVARVVEVGPCQYVDEESDDGCAFANPIKIGATSSRGRLAHCKWRFIDKKGRLLSPISFDYAGAFHEGLAVVQVNDRWGFIDRTGKFAIPLSFRDAGPFSEGLANVMTKDKRRGFIDKTGTFRFEADTIGAFAEGLAVASLGFNNGFAYLDTTGKRAFPGVFDSASNFYHGVALVKLSHGLGVNGTNAYINKSGRQIFQFVQDIPNQY